LANILTNKKSGVGIYAAVTIVRHFSFLFCSAEKSLRRGKNAKSEYYFSRLQVKVDMHKYARTQKPQPTGIYNRC
jgi:hypothetical protein